MINPDNVVCGCEIYISASTIQSELNAWGSRQIENWIPVEDISYLRISDWKISKKPDDYVN